MLSRLDSEYEDCNSIEDLKHLIQEEFDKQNPRMVLRHKWLRVSQRQDEAFTDFMTREKAARRVADADSKHRFSGSHMFY